MLSNVEVEPSRFCMLTVTSVLGNRHVLVMCLFCFECHLVFLFSVRECMAPRLVASGTCVSILHVTSDLT